MSFVAKYHQECDNCFEDAYGTLVRYDDYDLGSIRHIECPKPKPAGTICPVHFIELPISGICEECE